MNIVKKFFAILLCLTICFSVNILSLAANDTASIKISNVDSSMPGDTVTITINISKNPGIMAMAFCITYDSDALVYKNYSKGYLSSYTIKDHPDKGHIAFVNVENKDIATDGTIISLLFEVKETAKAGKHVITLANSNREKHGNKLHNSFSNSKQEYIIPLVHSGSVTVGENCNNSGHLYSEWNVVYPASCNSTGLRNRMCQRCSTFDEETIPAAHDFESDWTIDKAATPEEDGEMSRHCKKCDQVTDKITFKYEEIEDDKDNSSSDDSSNNDSSNDVSSDNDSSSNVSSGNDVDNETSNNSSETTTNKKPVINNQVGQKVPLQEVEKFEDYQQNIKPNLTPDNSQINTDSDNSKTENSSQTISDSSDITTGAIEENNSSTDNTQKEKTFFSTPTGIIMIVLCVLLSVGIIALGIWLIIKNKKAE